MDHPLPRRKRLALWLLLACAVLVSPAARGHEGDPRVWRIDFPSADRARAWVVDEMGLLLERSGGFVWLCDDALSQTAGLRAARPVSADGVTWIASTREGIYRSTDGGCGFTRVQGPLAGHFVGPLVAHPIRPEEVLAGTESLARPNDVFRTVDGGLTWQGAGLALGGRVRSLVRAPSAPEVVYLSHGAGAARSDDGGQRFSPIPLGPAALEPRADEFRFLGVDPDDPLRVYAALEQFPDGHLAASQDGGQSWTRLLTIPNDVPESLAAGPDGALWVSTPFEGLWRSADRGETWARLPTPGTLGCLALHPETGALWGCLRGSPLPWVVAASRDGGETWVPALGAYAAIQGGLGCPPDTPTGRVCGAQCDPADRACEAGGPAGDRDGGAADSAPDPTERPRDRTQRGCLAAPGALGWSGALALLVLGLCDRRRRRGIGSP